MAMNEKQMTRRDFLKGIAAGGAGLATIGIAMALDPQKKSSDSGKPEASGTSEQEAVAAAEAAANAANGNLSEREDTCGIADRTPYTAGATDSGYMGEAKPEKYITFMQSEKTEAKYAEIMKKLSSGSDSAGPAISGI